MAELTRMQTNGLVRDLKKINLKCNQSWCLCNNNTIYIGDWTPKYPVFEKQTIISFVSLFDDICNKSLIRDISISSLITTCARCNISFEGCESLKYLPCGGMGFT